MTLPLSLYVHLPWCVRKCPYCDFNSHPLRSQALPERYIDAVIRDLDTELPALEGRRIETVFFGGGTPSLFPPEDFARLLAAVRRRAALAEDAEITLEANPGTIERGRFAGYRDAGVNRVSLGAQTFESRALERLGRIHTPDDTRRAVDELHAAGLTNFNLDLMYALPEQGLDEALADVRTAIALRPAHISHYQLTLEPGTVFHANPPPLPDEETAWLMQIECQRVLADHGYVHYEVSAYAKPGACCRHNLNYWRFGDYLGLGAGAHGKLSAALPEAVLRTAKPKQPRDYQDSLERVVAPIGERQMVAVSALPFEFMLNALRLEEGFAAGDFEGRTGLPVSAVEAKLLQAVERGLAEKAQHGWRASELGRRFLNDLQAMFLP